VHQVSKETNKKGLCQNNLLHVLFARDGLLCRNTYYTALAVKIYIDMSGIVNPTLFSLACLLTLAHISLLEICKETNLSSTKTQTRNCQIDDSLCIVPF
jgi:hypothetical protein